MRGDAHTCPSALLQAQGIVPLPEDVKPVVVKTCPDDFDESASGSRSSRKRRIDALSHEDDSDQDVKPDVSSLAVDDESDLVEMKVRLVLPSAVTAVADGVLLEYRASCSHNCTRSSEPSREERRTA